MKKQSVINLVIVDESGSMASIMGPTVSGFNELVETIRDAQKKYQDQEHYVSLVTFNSNGIRTKLDRDPVSDIRKLKEGDYRPNGGTPLYDAMGMAITRLHHKLELVCPDAKVLVTILTDGEENASKEFNGRQIKALIEQLKETEWVFTFIGTDFDVESVARSLSINANHTISFEKTNEGTMYMYDTVRSINSKRFEKISKNDVDWKEG